mmetsp:Transcript_100606/g.189739  ORF Transcript_100606/g.189739 Transcript_100606/m.189739 type:complete len:246 (-) Transcript_100606:87-824(-)
MYSRGTPPAKRLSTSAVDERMNRAVNGGGSAYPKLTIWYLDHHFWRAECMRIPLFMRGIPFEDSRCGWEQMHASGMLHFGTCPALEVDGRSINQTHAAAAYVGKLTGMYPSDPWLAAKVDEVFAGLTDATELVTGTMGIRDPNRKIQVRQQLTAPDGRLTMFLTGIEGVLMQNGANGFVAGDTVTVADFALWRAVGWLSSGIIDGISPDYISVMFPTLWKLHCMIDTMPEVQSYKQRHPHHYRRR